MDGDGAGHQGTAVRSSHGTLSCVWRAYHIMMVRVRGVTVVGWVGQVGVKGQRHHHSYFLQLQT